LRHVELPNGTVIDYVVDGEGRRIWKKRNGVLEQGFLYSDQLRPVAELDGAGNVVARFIYGRHRNVPDAMVKGGKTYRIVMDHLGSPRMVIDTQTGAVAQRTDYDEFGRVLMQTTPGLQLFGFAGGIYDKDTGFVRFGARDYDPFAGRWTAKDPIRFRGGLNLYAYAINNPVNYRDFTGLDPTVLDWLLEADELHRHRNRYNNCPPTPPNPSGCDSEGRTWEQDPSAPIPIPGFGGKWRGSDGSECAYDDSGNHIPDSTSFNFCAEPMSLCHIFADFLPHFMFGGEYVKYRR
jgi:RHS repeat-associated protein